MKKAATKPSQYYRKTMIRMDAGELKQVHEYMKSPAFNGKDYDIKNIVFLFYVKDGKLKGGLF